MPCIAAGAQVSDSACLADDVQVGVGAIIEKDCTIGAGTSIGAYSIIWRGTRLGAGNRVFPFCSIGGEPQDKKFHGEDSRLVIGDNNTIREYCFINRGTAGGGGETRIGNNNWIMGYVHLAHDCCLSDDSTIANCAQFAGHVQVGNGAVIGGGALFHQFRRIGALAIIGGGEAVRQDVPPFAMVARGTVAVNGEGLRRAGFAQQVIARIKEAYRHLYAADLPLAEARQTIAGMAATESGDAAAPLQQLADFLAHRNLELIRPSRSP